MVLEEACQRELSKLESSTDVGLDGLSEVLVGLLHKGFLRAVLDAEDGLRKRR